MKKFVTFLLKYMMGGKIAVKTDHYQFYCCFDSINNYKAIRNYGKFEPEMLSRFTELANDASVIYDIGANIGLYSLTAVSCNSASKVFAFEPEEINCMIFEKSLKLNKFKSIILHQICLGERDGHINLCLKGSSGHFVSRSKRNECLVMSKMRTIDSMVDCFEIEPPKLVKIDVEGYEASVLRGMKKVLITYRPTILLEMHPKLLIYYDETESRIFDFMASVGYKFDILRKPGTGSSKTNHKQTHYVFSNLR
jgi:FkbM family methyltransferase